LEARAKQGSPVLIDQMLLGALARQQSLNRFVDW
jgi:hypothetical protein